MAAPVQRIVSLVPSMTETVCRLGVSNYLVGVTRYCVEPEEELRSVQRVGGTKNPKLETIAGLDPDLILANSEENKPEHISWLADRFEVLEAMPRTIPEAAEAVRELGRRLMREEELQDLLLEIEVQITRANVERMQATPVKVFYAIWKKPWMSINRDTYIHDVLTRAGAANVCADRDERYPVVRDEEIAELGAKVVLLPSEPYVFTDEDRAMALAEKSFGDEASVHTVDGRDYCWHGARSGSGLEQALDLLKRFREG